MNNVVTSVVDNGLCIGCGMCAGICPKGRLEMQFNDRGEYNPVELKDSVPCPEKCSLCYQVCPAHGDTKNETDIGRELYGDVDGIQYRKETGYYLSSYLGYSNTNGHRKNGASGGMAVLMLALLGSLSGFLFFNFHPAKIFMGDCGSLFVGFVIASASVMCATKSATLVGLALPALALGIPIFDTLFSMIRRFLERRSIFAPDRGHFHHRLIKLGIKQHHAVIIIYVMTLFSAGLGMFMMATHNIGSLIIFLCLLLLLLLLFRVVGSIQLREAMSVLQDKYRMANQRKQEQTSFEETQLHFRNACTYNQWWSAICKAAEQMDFAWISLKTTDKDGTVRTEVWRTAGAPPGLSDVVIMTVPLRNHDKAGAMEFEIAISINGSYESTGHRAKLFGRLIDEHEVINKV